MNWLKRFYRLSFGSLTRQWYVRQSLFPLAVYAIGVWIVFYLGQMPGPDQLTEEQTLRFTFAFIFGLPMCWFFPIAKFGYESLYEYLFPSYQGTYIIILPVFLFWMYWIWKLVKLTIILQFSIPIGLVTAIWLYRKNKKELASSNL